MPTENFPLRLGSACRWAAKQCIYLREEGYGEAVLDAVQPMFGRFAQTGDPVHLEQARRLLAGER